MNDTPVIAQRSPIAVEVETGKTYFWCQCGLSSKQPFCDGSHKSTAFTPIRYHAEESKKVFSAGASTLKVNRCVTAPTNLSNRHLGYSGAVDTTAVIP